jgi:TonB family protein
MTRLALRIAGVLAICLVPTLGGATDGPAGAQPPQGGCGDKNQRYYPPDAQSSGREGRAVIKCKITVRGTAEDCVVVSEDPPGLGFGQAALGMSCLFKFKPAMADGKPVEAERTIPIRFGLKK